MLARTKDYMLIYRKFDHLKVIEYSNLDFIGYMDIKKSIFGYLFLLAGGTIS
jgi:hypothetical protein